MKYRFLDKQRITLNDKVLALCAQRPLTGAVLTAHVNGRNIGTIAGAVGAYGLISKFGLDDQEFPFIFDAVLGAVWYAALFPISIPLTVGCAALGYSIGYYADSAGNRCLDVLLRQKYSMRSGEVQKQ